MCQVREKELEDQLNANSEKIEVFEQKLLGLLSRLHQMKHSQTELQAELHKESRERLTEVVKPKRRTDVRIPKTMFMPAALAKLGWTTEAIANALEANPGWRTKAIRI